jgi:ABC-type transport system involved in cytochrome bd biosynthesis fused ATPase/permease subunit
LGPASGGTLLAFSVAFFLAYKPLRDLTDARLALARARIAYDAIASLIGAPRATSPPRSRTNRARTATPTPTPTTTTTTTTPATANTESRGGFAPEMLELRDVQLSRGALPPISLALPPGKIVALVGATGIGKTTLLRALLGLEPIAAGEIRYGDASFDGVPPGPQHRPFAWVPQDAPLLADTLSANVMLGDGALGPREALEPLGAAHLVDTLAESRLGAGGRVVSGGERQWINLARAVATRAPVLLLDEPTSGLDEASQRAVLKAISSLKGHRSVVMVTHRPEPLEIADAVVRVA